MEQEEKVLFKATVVIPVKEGKVLLGMKTRKIGVGCWNGYGGGIEDGESVLECAVRELEEESGLKAMQESLEKVAIVDFHNEKSDGSTFVSRVHFFLAKNWNGEPIETEDGAMINHTLFDIENLPYEAMMPADREFFPLILKGKKLLVTSYYSPLQKELKRKVEIKEVEFLPED
ncbi:MAG: NUDIX domain-containing protein [Candidatus Paceibacterota bacterium]